MKKLTNITISKDNDNHFLCSFSVTPSRGKDTLEAIAQDLIVLPEPIKEDGKEWYRIHESLLLCVPSSDRIEVKDIGPSEAFSNLYYLPMLLLGNDIISEDERELFAAVIDSHPTMQSLRQAGRQTEDEEEREFSKQRPHR